MPTIIFEQQNGDAQSVVATGGNSVMIAAIQNGIDGIEAECGGGLACGTCHVYVDAAWMDRLTPAQEDELAMLDSVTAPRKACSRLACQIVVRDDLDGLVVRVPEADV